MTSTQIDQRVSLAVSTVIFALRPHPRTGHDTLWLPLVRRIREPYEGQWALPGGPLEMDEDLAGSARRTLERTTGLTPNYIEQLYSFGEIDRSPADRVVSIVYWALVRPDEAARAVDGENVEWFVADEVPDLAFDHNRIVEYALWRLRAKITYSPIAHAFLESGVHPRRAARGARGGAAQAARPGELPASGAGQQRHRPHRHMPHRHQPSTPGALPRRHRPRSDHDDRTDPIRRRADRRRPRARAATPSSLEGPWIFDLVPGYGPGCSEDDVIPEPVVRPGQLPVEYQKMSDDELHARIRAAKEKLGERVVILGHFYQRDEVVQYADFVGDSFQLANAALTKPDAEAIVFCGVHFMAETADILARPEQHVILPNLAAGCSMADMADEDSVEAAGRSSTRSTATEPDADGKLPVIPVTYMNSSAALKAFCGGTAASSARRRTRRPCWSGRSSAGSGCCSSPTSTSAATPPRRWASRWSRCRCGTRASPLGGNTAERLAGREGDALARLLLGAQALHRRPDREGPRRAPRREGDRAPRGPMPVVDAADASGSTDNIRRFVAASEPGDVIAIGTEINMVNRLAAEYPDHTIFCLDPVVCPCSTMYRIHPGYLAWVLEGLVEGEVRNEIVVDDDVARDAKVALERMLAALPKGA